MTGVEIQLEEEKGDEAGDPPVGEEGELMDIEDVSAGKPRRRHRGAYA